MIARILHTSAGAARVVVAAALALSVFGVVRLRDARVDTLPEFGPPTIEVQTEALGLSAEEVEQLITVPLEQDLLDGVAWLDTIRSKSVPGLSDVTLVFERGTDLYRARQVVQERISQAAGLPNVSRPPQMLQPASSTSRTLLVGLSSDRLTALQIGVLARWTIRPRLLAVPGVSNVAIWGQRERQLQVLVDPAKLRDRNVRLEQVIASTGNALWVSPLTFLEASTPGTGGFIDTPQQRLGIQHNLPIISTGDLAKVAIDDAPAGVTLGDVATIAEDHQPLIGDAAGRDGSGGFLLAVDKLPGANTLEVSRGVERALAELQPGLDGLRVDTSAFRPAADVERARTDVARVALLALTAILVGLAVVLFDWRAALAAALPIGTAVVVAALVLEELDQTFNVVVLAGIAMALGPVVFDAIHHVEDPRRPLSVRTARTAIWSTLLAALAVVPLVLVRGVSGDDFFPPLAWSFLAALAAAVVAAITVAPAASALLLGTRAVPESPLRRLVERPSTSMRSTRSAAAVSAALALAIGSVAAIALTVARADKALLPPLRGSSALVRWQAAPGTALTETRRITTRAAEELRKVEGVRSVAVNVGQASLGDRAVGSDGAEMWIALDPNTDHARTLRAVRAVVAGYPGLRHEVTTYADSRLRSTLPGASDDLTVRLFGADLDVLHQKAEQVRRMLNGISGVRARPVSTNPVEPSLQVDVDIPAARTVGLKPGDVRRAATTLLSGLRVGSLFEDQKVFDVVVWSTPQARHSLSSAEDLLIDTLTGAPVRLGDVARVHVAPQTSIVEHQDVSRFVDVRAEVAGDVGAALRTARARLARVPFPSEYHAEFLSDHDRQQSAQRRTGLISAAALVGLVLLLQAAFGSWRLAFTTAAALPVALLGGVVAFWIEGGPLTLATVAGLLALLAFAARALVGRVFGSGPTVAVGAAVVTAVAIVPAVALGPSPGLDVLRPMTGVVLGGLATTLLAHTFVLPVLQDRFSAAPAVDLHDDVSPAPDLIAEGVQDG